MRRRVAAVTAVLAAVVLSGCSTLCDRRDFARRAASGAEPVISEYRGYIAKDGSLNENEKKQRNMLADELQGLLKDGGK